MTRNTTLLVMIISLFGVLELGRQWLSKKIVRGRIEKNRPVPWLWIQERTLLVFWCALVVRSLAPTLFTAVDVLRLFPAVPLGVFGENDILRLFGLAILAAAIMLQLRAKWELSSNWSAAVNGPVVRKGAISRNGLYRWSRNPMYCGSLLQAFALNLVLQNAVALGLGMLTYCYVRANINREEALLREVKGAEYARYCKNVPRFFWKW